MKRKEKENEGRGGDQQIATQGQVNEDDLAQGWGSFERVHTRRNALKRGNKQEVDEKNDHVCKWDTEGTIYELDRFDGEHKSQNTARHGLRQETGMNKGPGELRENKRKTRLKKEHQCRLRYTPKSSITVCKCVCLKHHKSEGKTWFLS